MSVDASQFDKTLLADNGPAAIVIQQWLKPVGDDIIFPPTYAGKERGEGPQYNIDPPGADGPGATCTIDSLPSQANRIEPAFATIADGKLVPQMSVKAKADGETVDVDLLVAGHRVADAVIRFSPLADEVKRAIAARGKGDSAPLARLAPTSLVFGMWDSRDSGVKVPRLINSIIRGFDCQRFRRSAQFFPALDFEAAGVGKEDELKKASTEGMAEVPATLALGGIRAAGGIRRDASLNLCTLRDLRAGSADEMLKLQRYILGLALVALTYLDGKTLNLRQGCQLVAVPDRPVSRKLVNADGTETDLSLTADDAVAFAAVAALAFFGGRMPEPRAVDFDPKKAKDALKKPAKRGAAAADGSSPTP